MSIDIHIIGGSLGAGKTSTLRHLLSQLGENERVAVIVNDFGEARIDAALLGDDRHALRSIPDACICCTAPEGFVAAVRELMTRADRIFVEPTGLARASDLVDTLKRAPFAGELTVGPVVAVVDPAPFADGTLPHDALDQLAVADVVVVNRVDRCTDEQLGALRAWLDALWPGPVRRVETVHGQVPLEILSWPEGTGPKIKRHDHHDHHDHERHDQQYAARSQIWPPDAIFRRRALEAAMNTAAGRSVARIKGLMRTDEGVYRLDLAAGKLDVAPSDWRRDSRVDLIAPVTALAALDDTLEAIARALLPASASAETGAVEIAWDTGSRLFDREALRALPGGVADVSLLVAGRAGEAARLGELLRALSLSGEREFVVVAQDGYITPPTPLTELEGALLVHSLDQGPLPSSSGGPFRLLIPGSRSPCANVKGVVRVVVR